VLAALEQRQQRGRQRLVGVRRRAERDLRRLRRRLEKPAAERVGGGEGDRVQHAVERAPATLEVGRDGRQVLGIVDVELQHVGLARQAPRDALGDAQAAAEAGEDDLGALLLRLGGDGERDRAVGEDPGDEQAAAFEQRHRPGTLRGAGHVRRAARHRGGERQVPM